MQFLNELKIPCHSGQVIMRTVGVYPFTEKETDLLRNQKISPILEHSMLCSVASSHIQCNYCLNGV